VRWPRPRWQWAAQGIRHTDLLPQSNGTPRCRVAPDRVELECEIVASVALKFAIQLINLLDPSPAVAGTPERPASSALAAGDHWDMLYGLAAVDREIDAAVVGGHRCGEGARSPGLGKVSRPRKQRWGDLQSPEILEPIGR
jgi:hypothetical protein